MCHYMYIYVALPFDMALVFRQCVATTTTTSEKEKRSRCVCIYRYIISNRSWAVGGKEGGRGKRRVYIKKKNKLYCA